MKGRNLENTCAFLKHITHAPGKGNYSPITWPHVKRNISRKGEMGLKGDILCSDGLFTVSAQRGKKSVLER